MQPDVSYVKKKNATKKGDVNHLLLVVGGGAGTFGFDGFITDS